MNEFIDKFNSVPLGQKVLGLILLMFMLGGGAYMGLLSPTYDAIAAQQSQVQALQREKESLDQLKRNRAQVLAQLETLKRQLLIAQEKLPKDAEIPSLLQRIHNQAKTAGLEILEFQRNNDVQKDFYVEIPVNMKLEGTYDELANFFFYVGRMTRIVNVQDIGLVRLKKGLVAEGGLSVTARATTFRFKTEAELGAAPGGPQ